jgi:hypothetical protein
MIFHTTLQNLIKHVDIAYQMRIERSVTKLAGLYKDEA